ncbi:histidine phosphatase family protein [Phenylobacterium sp.]|jgi:broad specificity phosphatase PhoE|uniref:histidine phosphatase family protein n=1 Tax=Phenylobacterium sp. TaxID=1871053 RepID=UPI002E31CBC2|nr:histidine phosphatase family protein [Phenylobacterium sp.]HEX2558454.1 histidine phosphatase family protein [Phenylobacterium sp.]
MARLLLVKHAHPQMLPEMNAQRWTLSEAGRESCGWLAEAFAREGVRRIYASLEPKALETAALAAAALGLEVRPRAGLGENDRTGVSFASQEIHVRRFHAFFDEPAKVSMGTESANAAHARFSAAVRAAVEESAGETLAIVAHGTVITLLVSRANGLAPFPLWESLGLPSYVALDPYTLAWDGRVQERS